VPSKIYSEAKKIGKFITDKEVKTYNTLARKPPTSVVGMNRQKSLFESRVHK
jgi:hypothetical protein